MYIEWNINSSLGLCPTDFKFASPNNHMSRFIKINSSFYPQTSYWFCFPGEPLLTEVTTLLFACAFLWLNLDHSMIRRSMIASYPLSTSDAALLLLIDLRLHTCFFSLIDISSPVILVSSHHLSTLFWLTPLSFPPGLSFHNLLFQSLSCPKFQFPYLSPFAPTALVVLVEALSCVWLFVTPWTAARQASLSSTVSWGLLKILSIESVMPANHLIFCCPLLLLSSILPSIRVFSNE